MKPFTRIAVIVFSIVSLLHFLRLVFQWQIVFNGIVVPLWLSLIGFLMAGLLAFMLYREAKGPGKIDIR